MKYFLLALCLLLGSGCTFFTRVESPAVLPPPLTPTPEICSPETPGLSIRVLFGQRDADGQRVTINGSGFLPGERVTIRIHGQGAPNTITLEATDYPVPADGIFSSVETLPVDDPTMRWEARVIHQRGVACLRFALP